jgi:flagellar hook-length control protein FliK
MAPPPAAPAAAPEPTRATSDAAQDPADAPQAVAPPDQNGPAGLPPVSPATATLATTAPLPASPPPAAANASESSSATPRPEPPAQLASAVATLARQGEGNHRLTLQLDPGALGRIEVVIDRGHGTPATVTLTVERPETLLRLVRDQDQLARALDQAGIPAEDRQLRFQLAAPDAPPAAPDPARADARPAPMPPPIVRLRGIDITA